LQIRRPLCKHADTRGAERARARPCEDSARSAAENGLPHIPKTIFQAEFFAEVRANLRRVTEYMLRPGKTP